MISGQISFQLDSFDVYFRFLFILTCFIISKHKSVRQYGAILVSNPVALVKQLFMGPWGQCIIHATLQPVWRTCCSDIHELANRSIVNYGSGGDVREYICIWYEIPMGQLNRFVYIYIFIQTNANVSRNIVCGPELNSNCVYGYHAYDYHQVI